MGVVLVYHRVTVLDADPWGLAVAPTRFAEQLEMLSHSFAPAELRALARAGPVRGARVPVAVTFDDGYCDNLTAALPALERAGWPATFFVAGGGEQKEFWWDELDRLLLEPAPSRPLALPASARLGPAAVTVAGPPLDPEEARSWRAARGATGPRQGAYVHAWSRLSDLDPAVRDEAVSALRDAFGAAAGARTEHRRLTDSELAGMAEQPGVEIGAHTISHPRLARLSPERQRSEIVASRRRLETIGGRPVTAFAYPYGRPGDFDGVTSRLVREAGMDVACSNVDGTLTLRTNRLSVPRVFVRDVPADALERKLMGLLRRTR